MVDINVELFLVMIIMFYVLHKYRKHYPSQILFITTIPTYIIRNFSELNEMYAIICLMLCVIINFQYLWEKYQK